MNFIPTINAIEIDSNTFFDKICDIVIAICNEKFTDYNKKQVHKKTERINFACPYCGDSVTDTHKKRCNIYKNGYSMHCYNCGTHLSLEEFLRDFGYSLNNSEIIHIHTTRSETKFFNSNNTSLKNSEFLYNYDILKKYAIGKTDIFKWYKLYEIEHECATEIKGYLKNRFQYDFAKFGWDPILKRLFIFNMTRDKHILGFQIRNFNPKYTKYVTHSLEMIYKTNNIPFEKTDEFIEVNRLSYFFGLENIDFNRMITITEGPLDAFLLNNAGATCGSENDIPFDISNKRYMYDYDTAGAKQSLKKINEGQTVFLWKKYLKDLGLIEKTNGIKIDYTEIRKLTSEMNISLLPVDSYFSTNKFDAYWI
jgi:predicted RNA-binding Zn-ribbon protein involved in translation (DUF1610 family)